MFETLRKLLSDESGASAVEYGLLVALIALVASIGMTAAGGALNGLFDRVTNALNAI